MDGAELYGIYGEELESEDLTCEAWEALNAREKLVWGKLARRLPREAPRQAMLSEYPD